MEYKLLGWPSAGPTLRLDHEQFSYAGKFVMSSTGKAVVRENELIAAAAFDADRTDETTLVIRYVTVRKDHRGEEIGARLLRFVRERAVERGYERVKIAVNNPYAYEAAYKAGFGYTGERTGIAERVLYWPAENRRELYRKGLESYLERDLNASEQRFVESRTEVPPVVDL